MTSLVEQFAAASQHVQSGNVQPQTIRWKLHGLSKQANEGDYKEFVTSPVRGDLASLEKARAWKACRGMDMESSMRSYVAEVVKFDPNFVPTKVVETDVVSSMGEVTKEGILFKQQDVFKGWRPRHFVIQDSFLHYFLDITDAVPKNSMDMTGCKITEVRSTKIGSMEYHPFIISHPKSTTVYNLASESKKDAKEWIAALRLCSSKAEVQFSPCVVTDSDIAVARDRSHTAPNLSVASSPLSVTAEAVTAAPNPWANSGEDVNRRTIPLKYAYKIEQAVERILEWIDPNAKGWEPLFERSGVTASKKPGDVLVVRGVTDLPFNIVQVFGVISNSRRMTELDKQLESNLRLQSLSYNTSAEYLRFKQVWPTAARDLSNIVHWRKLDDGTIVIVSFSEKFDDIYPLEDSCVRAHLVLGGYILKPSPIGTQLYYLVQTDLRGTLPTSVTNFVISSTPMVLSQIRKSLKSDCRELEGTIPPAVPSTPPTYEDYEAMVEANQVKKADGTADIRSSDGYAQTEAYITSVGMKAQRPLLPENILTKSVSAPVLSATTDTEPMSTPKHEYVDELEAAVSRLLELTDGSKIQDWEHLFTKNDVEAYTQPGAVVTIKGVSTIPHNIMDVFKLIRRLDRLTEIDPMLADCHRCQDIAKDVFVDYLRFKPVWPVAGRDMCNVVHWRMLPDGSVVLLSFAERNHQFEWAPVAGGCVRAKLLLGGYVLKPCANGTHVQYVVQTDLNGSLPAAAGNFVATKQPMIIDRIRTTLNEDKKKGVSMDEHPFDHVFSYDDFFAQPGGMRGDVPTYVSPTLNPPQAAVPCDSNATATSSFEVVPLPPLHADDIEHAVTTILALANPPADQVWQPVFKKNGIVATQLPGKILCVKGVLELPYPAKTIFGIIKNRGPKCELDPMMESFHLRKRHSLSTSIEYARFKPVWPTAARDAATVSHWRLMADGTCIIAYYSDTKENLSPLEKACVRCHCHVGGYVMKPLANGGTHITYAVSTDLKGNLPTAVTSIAASGQPMILDRIRIILEKEYSKAVGPSPEHTYKDFCDVLDYAKTFVPAAASGTAIGSVSNASPSPPADKSTEPSVDNSVGELPHDAVISATIPVLPIVVGVFSVVLLAMAYYYYSQELFYLCDFSFLLRRETHAVLLFLIFICLLARGWAFNHNVSRQGYSNSTTLPPHLLNIRFPVELEAIRRTTRKCKNKNGTEVSVTHVVVKCIANTLVDFPGFNGHLVNGQMIMSKTDGIDISVVTVSQLKTIALKVCDAQKKPVTYIADELTRLANEERNQQDKPSSDACINTFAARFPVLSYVLDLCGCSPEKEDSSFPLGVCTVLTAPVTDPSDSNFDVNLAPTVLNAPTAMSVSVGGIRVVHTSSSNEGKGYYGLNVSVTVDTRVGSITDIRQFCSALRRNMNTSGAPLKASSGIKNRPASVV